jgi:hypothetical protein
MDLEDKKFLEKLESPSFIFLKFLDLISIILGVIYFFVDDDNLYLILFLIFGFISLFIQYIRRQKKK